MPALDKKYYTDFINSFLNEHYQSQTGLENVENDQPSSPLSLHPATPPQSFEEKYSDDELFFEAHNNNSNNGQSTVVHKPSPVEILKQLLATIHVQSEKIENLKSKINDLTQDKLNLENTNDDLLNQNRALSLFIEKSVKIRPNLFKQVAKSVLPKSVEAHTSDAENHSASESDFDDKATSKRESNRYGKMFDKRHEEKRESTHPYYTRFNKKKS